MRRSQSTVIAVALLVVGATVGAGAAVIATSGPPTAAQSGESPGPASGNTNTPADDDGGPGPSGPAAVSQFGSEAAFTNYVQRGQLLAERGRFTGPRVRFQGQSDVVLERDDGAPTETPMATAVEDAQVGGGDGAASGGGGASTPERVSGTNNQEVGIDEPDILKTNGQEVYYAPREGRVRAWEEDSDEQFAGDETHILSVEDPANPTEIGNIETRGRHLLIEDTLVVIDDDELVAYDVSDPSDPDQTWSRPLESQVVTARLHNGQLYLVTRTGVSMDDPCPIEPLGGDASVQCTDVYHPNEQAPVDSTYTAFRFDPISGEVQDSVSFVGTAENTVVYMSQESLYVTYTQPTDRGELRIDFLLSEQADQLPSWVEGRLREIRDYNISSQSKQQEADRVLQQYYSSLDEQQREVVQRNIRNDWRDYLTDNQRELVRTGIVRVPIDDELSVDTVDTVPGRPLNQFSMDEHDGTLRITTTIPAAGGADSRNDLYVLDSDSLDRMGSAQDMGVTERVYSVRYVGDTAYVVTFRRIDPFHVVDLSDPSDPEEVGELELPGFSSYLHPVDDNHVLGIGREDGEVKAVLFDVSNPSNPTIADDYILNDRWSAISESHHAFLQDREHGVFFLPTGDGGNVIDYTNGDLSLEARIETDGAAQRAMYINDYMYVFGREEVVVVDETDWERETTLQLD